MNAFDPGAGGRLSRNGGEREEEDEKEHWTAITEKGFVGKGKMIT